MLGTLRLRVLIHLGSRPRRVQDDGAPGRGDGNSGGTHGLRLRSLGAGADLEGHRLPLLQGLVALHVDCRVVDEDVLSAFIDRDEAEALLSVEPLDGPSRHLYSWG